MDGRRYGRKYDQGHDVLRPCPYDQSEDEIPVLMQVRIRMGGAV